MATHEISMLGNCMPDTTGRCWIEPYDVAATNDVWKYQIIRLLNPATGNWHGVYGSLWVPKNYVGTPVVTPVWTTTATSGNAQFRFTYRCVGGNDAESLDQTSNQEQLTPAASGAPAPSAANERKTVPAISLTAGNLAASDLMQFLFERGDNSAADTIAADITLHDLIFSYADA